LREPLRLAGEPFANLFASTSGTDADWVVKIIDVWPDEVQERPTLGGYQQMLSADIFRGATARTSRSRSRSRRTRRCSTASACRT
jgi:predicted acyl esterase